MGLLIGKSWRIVCSHCGDAYNARCEDAQIRRLIDQPCRKCNQSGVDAVDR